LPATLLAVCLLAPSAAWAAPGLAGADCSSPALMAYMQAHIGHGAYVSNGKLNPNRFDYGPITASTTFSTTATSITCEVTIGLSGSRGTHPIHGRFTAMTTGGKWHWQPGY
jgi:hypothetical protein